MENSTLEKIGNAQLFYLLQYVIENNEYNKFSFDDIEDVIFKENCDFACKMVGVSDVNFIDYNFILATLIINKNYDFNSKKPTGIIEKPKPHLYSFDIDEDRTEFVMRSYRHKMTSYLVELLIPTFNSMDQDGAIDYYSGKETEVTYYDGETNSVKLDKDSINLIS
jgi:hypothetical protein